VIFRRPLPSSRPSTFFQFSRSESTQAQKARPRESIKPRRVRVNHQAQAKYDRNSAASRRAPATYHRPSLKSIPAKYDRNLAASRTAPATYPPPSLKSIPAKYDRNLAASRTAPATYPPPSLKSIPRPKESRASHRTSDATKPRNYPDRKPASQLNRAIQMCSESKSAPNLAYFVTRTPSQQLPIYLEKKRGGNLLRTKLRKIDGDKEVLRQALEEELVLSPKDCAINPITGHIVMKGWHKPQIEAYLKARRF